MALAHPATSKFERHENALKNQNSRGARVAQFQLRSWSQSREIEPHMGLHAKYRACLDSLPLSLSLSPFALLPYSLTL